MATFPNPTLFFSGDGGGGGGGLKVISFFIPPLHFDCIFRHIFFFSFFLFWVCLIAEKEKEIVVVNMLTIKRVATVVSNYQEEGSGTGLDQRALGCGRNCLAKCCLPGILQNFLFYFSSFQVKLFYL